jgi:hypothetical protein
MEKTMAVESQENRIRRAPLIFIVPACGFVVAARTKPFQPPQSTSEQVRCPNAQRLTPELAREINPEQSLRELRRKSASLKPGKVELLLFLFFGLVALVAIAGCFSQLLHLLGGNALEQTVRVLLTK